MILNIIIIVINSIIVAHWFQNEVSWPEIPEKNAEKNAEKTLKNASKMGTHTASGHYHFKN